MQAGAGEGLGRDLGRIFGPGPRARSDRELLDAFAAGRDPAAFEALVARHGPLVRGVCRRVARDPHAADDAFQATFLVLLLKAGRVGDADRLGPWLYGVAARVAGKARARAERDRARFGGSLVEPDAPAPDRDRADLPALVDAELAALPPPFRAVAVLCLVEGLTAEEAAHRLGCPVGTAKSRLARARAALRDRLARRGVAPAMALPHLEALARAIAREVVPDALIRSTATVAASASVPPSLLALTQGAVPAMIHRTTILAALLAGGVALGGVGLAMQGPPRPAPLPSPADRAQLQAQTTENMRRVLAAFLDYESQHGRFPTGAIFGRDGQPKLSWRVALLPYLGREAAALHDRFHLDEPWDSPHNRALIPEMPACYATPDSPAPPGETRFRGYLGESAMFFGKEGIRVQDVPDGTSRTILIVQADRPTLWTAPEGLTFKPGFGVGRIDEAEPGRCLVGMADGAVLPILRPTETTLRAMISRNGGEILGEPTRFTPELARGLRDEDSPWRPRPGMGPPPAPAWDQPEPAAPGGQPEAAGMGPAPGPPAESVEDRLRRVEEKLDRLIERLDAAGVGKPAP